MFKRLQDGLTAEMYAEFTLCKDLPLQCKHEQLVEARQAALLGKKIQEAKALSEQRIALGYTPSGISAADMRLRLTALLPRIDARYLDLIAVDDINYAYLEICVDFQDQINSLLVSNSPVSPPFIPPRLDSVVLMRNISEGITSSGKSVVADGLFTAAHTVDGLAVKVKMFHATHAARAMQEYQIMGKLYQAAPRHFVRPYAFLDGAHGQILPYSPKDKDHCVAAMCLVMEKGTTDMREYLVNYHFDRIEGLAISSNFLDILALASQCNIVLNDFKPSNIVRVHDGLRYHLKAIDFDSSREEGQEMAAEATAAYCSPEVAREILARKRGERPTVLLARHKMDVMALGLIVFEIANNLKSLWDSQVPPITEHWDILNALARLTDEDVKRIIEKSFQGSQFSVLRRWLEHALKVDPKDRASALELLHGHSLFGNKSITVDEKGLISHFNMGFNRLIENDNSNTAAILESVEELSNQLQGSLGLLGASLDSIALQVALGSEPQSKDISALVQAVSQQKILLQTGELNEQALQSAVAAAMSHVEKSVQANVSTSLKEMMSSIGPSLTDKIDVLMDMVGSLQSQSDRFAEEFRWFRSVSKDQSRMLALIEEQGNFMPLTFVVVPHFDISGKLPTSASMIDKMKNSAKRKVNTVTRLLWEKSRIVFICPVTLQQVLHSTRLVH
jgi:serine/threonine protein kinase